MVWIQAAEWIMLSQFWTRDHEKMKKRARQADFVVTNLETKKNDWFYFDVIHRRLVYLGADFKSWVTAPEVEDSDEERGKKHKKNKQQIEKHQNSSQKNGSFRSHQNSQKQWPTIRKQTVRSISAKYMPLSILNSLSEQIGIWALYTSYELHDKNRTNKFCDS